MRCPLLLFLLKPHLLHSLSIRHIFRSLAGVAKSKATLGTEPLLRDARVSCNTNAREMEPLDRARVLALACNHLAEANAVAVAPGLLFRAALCGVAGSARRTYNLLMLVLTFAALLKAAVILFLPSRVLLSLLLLLIRGRASGWRGRGMRRLTEGVLILSELGVHGANLLVNEREHLLGQAFLPEAGPLQAIGRLTQAALILLAHRELVAHAKEAAGCRTLNGGLLAQELLVEHAQQAQ